MDIAWRMAWLVLAGFLAACDASTLNRSETLNPSALTEPASDIARTFDDARVVLPRRRGQPPLVARMGDDALHRHLAGLPASWRFPTILYLHGCTGLGRIEPMTTLAQDGFAIIAPNSFARRFRPLQCRPSRQTGGENVFVFEFRLVEISYALHRMAALPWVDLDRLFLVGTSEGGVAAALYRGDEFLARVITQWTCNGAPFIRGLAAPPDEPVLAIVRRGDPWYHPSRTAAQEGHCGQFIGQRPRSRSLLVEGDDHHDIYGNAGAMRAIRDFLRDELLRAPGR
jgi:dienelactone hydrolase